MKPISLVLTIAAATLVANRGLRADDPTATSQSPPVAPVRDAPPKPAPETPAAAKPGAPRRGDPRKQFDKDGDGVLSPEERKAAAEGARKKLLERFDQDGDGQISATERQAVDADREAKMLARFDADGDGKLSPAERQAARQGQPVQGRPAPVAPAKAHTSGKRLRLDARPKVLEKFDKDGDGQLSDAERAAAREVLKARRRPKTVS
jgi:Ca2+-binding EF-hand superfamily protein